MFNYLKEHPPIIITLLLLYSSILGITYDYLLYSQFNINVFQISEIEDFLFSWIKNENVFISLVIIYTLPITEYFSKRVIYSNKYNNFIYNKKKLYRFIFFCLLIIIFIYGLFSEKNPLTTLIFHILIIYYVIKIRYYYLYNKLHVNKINSHFFTNFIKKYFLFVIFTVPFLSIYTQSLHYSTNIQKLTYQYYYIKLKKEDNELKKYAFVGKNSNYHIFYKGTTENNETILINNSEIKYFREENKSNIIYEK